MNSALACMLHEGFGNQGVMGEAVVMIIPLSCTEPPSKAYVS